MHSEAHDNINGSILLSAITKLYFAENWTGFSCITWIPSIPKSTLTEGMSVSYNCARRKWGQMISKIFPIAPLTNPLAASMFDLSTTLAPTNISSSFGKLPVLLISTGNIFFMWTFSVFRVESTSWSYAITLNVSALCFLKCSRTALLWLCTALFVWYIHRPPSLLKICQLPHS